MNKHCLIPTSSFHLIWMVMLAHEDGFGCCINMYKYMVIWSNIFIYDCNLSTEERFSSKEGKKKS